jgi:hypothetical protein
MELKKETSENASYESAGKEGKKFSAFISKEIASAANLAER